MLDTSKIHIFYACDDNFVKFTMVSFESMKQNASRDKKYHVIDNHAGSVVFRPYVINMFKEYESLNQNVEFLIVNTIFFNNDEFNVLVDTINKLQNSNISLKDANEILENNFNIEDGFIYQDSVYNPKEF